ncbi:MAG: glycosyltransferase [Pseudomonadota bacterium]
MKKVFWITSFFPPRINVATNRNVKFLKYLAQYEWEALVACPKETLDQTKTSRRLMSQIGSAVTVLPMPSDPFFFLHDRADVNKMAKYLGYLINNIIPPDGHIFWSLLALNQIGKEMKKHKPDIVYTTCSPFSINLIGLWVKLKYHVPWVTDFRDLWTLNPDRKRFLSSYHHVISNVIEKVYLNYCDALIVNTDASKSRMVDKYPFLKNKTCIIPNGFDPEDIPTENQSPIENSFFYGGLIDRASNYTPLPILKLLSRLEDKGLLNFPWELHYAGNEGSDFIDLCVLAGINGRERTHGYLDHGIFYGLIQSMDYVIVCMPRDVDTSSWIPARFYDYIGNKSRIICLAPRESELASIIKQYGKGVTLFYDEPEDIQIKKLHAFIVAHKDNSMVSEEFIERFSRKNLALQLSQIFNHVSMNSNERVRNA